MLAKDCRSVQCRSMCACHKMLPECLGKNESAPPRHVGISWGFVGGDSWSKVSREIPDYVQLVPLLCTPGFL